MLKLTELLRKGLSCVVKVMRILFCYFFAKNYFSTLSNLTLQQLKTDLVVIAADDIWKHCCQRKYCSICDMDVFGFDMCADTSLLKIIWNYSFFLNLSAFQNGCNKTFFII